MQKCHSSCKKIRQKIQKTRRTKDSHCNHQPDKRWHYLHNCPHTAFRTIKKILVHSLTAKQTVSNNKQNDKRNCCLGYKHDHVHAVPPLFFNQLCNLCRPNNCLILINTTAAPVDAHVARIAGPIIDAGDTDPY